MMRPTPIAGFLLGSTLWALALCDAPAQLNEDKVLRDASGVFTGRVGGGSLTVPGSMGATPYSPPPARGKARLLFKDGRQRGATTHPMLDGNDRVVLVGAFRKLDVRRGGKEIVVNGRGTANDDSDGFGVWSGNATGLLKDQGRNWRGGGTMGGLRDFIGDPADTIDDFTERMRGFKVSGSD
jgi:hypothetical protein